MRKYQPRSLHSFFGLTQNPGHFQRGQQFPIHYGIGMWLEHATGGVWFSHVGLDAGEAGAPGAIFMEYEGYPPASLHVMIGRHSNLPPQVG